MSMEAEALRKTHSRAWPMRFTPGEIDARRAAGEWLDWTVGDEARDRAMRNPQGVCHVDGDTLLTYGQAVELGSALARALTESGLRHGDTVSFQLPNWWEAVIVDLACAFGGFVVNPIIPIYRHAELRHILRDCRAKAIFVPQTFRGIDYRAMIGEIRDELPDLAHVITVRGDTDTGDEFQRLLAVGQASEATLTPARGQDAKLILYTSGTTGQPKGAIYSHEQARRPIWASFTAWDLKEGDRLLMPSPVTHTTGFNYGLEMPFHFGIRTVLMERWDAGPALQIIDESGIAFMIGATPFLAELVEAAVKAGSKLPSLRIFACGGAAVPPDLVRRGIAQFAGCRIFRVFGSTECPMITQGVLDDPDLAASTDGRVYDWEVVVLDAEGNALPPGAEGELAARGPSLFRGYTDAHATASAFDKDGYFLTGDLGTMSGTGIITVTGRKKDIIIRGGENISAKEVEDALHRIPGIRSAAVVSMPHPRLGEGVCAFVVAEHDSVPDREMIAAALKDAGLAPQKWPERVELTSEFPMTASGKVQKHILRQIIADKLLKAI